MIEFTISRVCMSVCGLLLLAAVIAPVTGMYESRAAGMESHSADKIAMLIDNFYYSEAETFTVPVSDIVPSTMSYVEFDGYLVTMTTERGVYKSGTNVTVVTGTDGPFGYGNILRLTKNGNAVIAERLA